MKPLGRKFSSSNITKDGDGGTNPSIGNDLAFDMDMKTNLTETSGAKSGEEACENELHRCSIVSPNGSEQTANDSSKLVSAMDGQIDLDALSCKTFQIGGSIPIVETKNASTESGKKINRDGQDINETEGINNKNDEKSKVGDILFVKVVFSVFFAFLSHAH